MGLPWLCSSSEKHNTQYLLLNVRNLPGPPLGQPPTQCLLDIMALWKRTYNAISLLLGFAHWSRSLSSKYNRKVSHARIRIMEKGWQGNCCQDTWVMGVQSHRLESQSWLAVGYITLLDSLWYQWLGTHSSRLCGHLGRASPCSTEPTLSSV